MGEWSKPVLLWMMFSIQFEMLRGQVLIWNTCHASMCNPPHTLPEGQCARKFWGLSRQKMMVGIAYMKSLASVFRVKILTRKMTIFHEGKWSRRRLNMLRDHNNIVEKDVSVWIEKENQFLLLTPDLSVRRRIHNKCSKSSYLDNQSSNDEARTCPELGKIW